MNPKQTHRHSRRLGAAALAGVLCLSAPWALAQDQAVASEGVQAAQDAQDEAVQEILIITEAPLVLAELQHEHRDASQPLSREEVMADLNLWRRAGLGSPQEDGSLTQAELDRRMALYQAWRRGAAFDQELARVEAQTLDRDEALAMARMPDQR